MRQPSIKGVDETTVMTKKPKRGKEFGVKSGDNRLSYITLIIQCK